MARIVNLSRRRLLTGAAALPMLALAVRLGQGRLFPAAAANPAGRFAPNVYLTIDHAGEVAILAHRSEMGTGIRTGLPAVLADELEADWRRVKVVQADGDARYGDQNTDGSRSIRQFYTPMREAGAAARQMLEAAAALTWDVPVTECAAQNHEVLHRSSGRSLGFGALVETAAKLPVPPNDQLRLKDATQFRYIGDSLPIVDLADILRGAAVFGIDVTLPGLKFASIERCPVYGGRVRSVDPQAAREVAGVEQVIELPAAPIPSGFTPLAGSP